MVDRDEVRRIARLARLEIRPEDEERVAGQLGRILEWVERLGDLPEGADADRPSAPAPLRADDPRPGLTREEALGAAPRADGEHFRVPPVLPGEEPG